MGERLRTKTEGACKGGNGSHCFDVAAPVEAGYAPTAGPVVEGKLTQVGVMTIPAGQSSAPHTHEQWLYPTAGRLRAVVDGQERKVGPGDLIPAGIVHGVDVLPGDDAEFFTCKDLRHGISGTPVAAE